MWLGDVPYFMIVESDFSIMFASIPKLNNETKLNDSGSAVKMTIAMTILESGRMLVTMFHHYFSNKSTMLNFSCQWLLNGGVPEIIFWLKVTLVLALCLCPSYTIEPLCVLCLLSSVGGRSEDYSLVIWYLLYYPLVLSMCHIHRLYRVTN